MDFSIYLDISNEVKFAWKIQVKWSTNSIPRHFASHFRMWTQSNNFVFQELQRNMAERGHSLESIKASIEARKPDFDAYIGNSF